MGEPLPGVLVFGAGVFLTLVTVLCFMGWKDYSNSREARTIAVGVQKGRFDARHELRQTAAECLKRCGGPHAFMYVGDNFQCVNNGTSNR